MEKSSFIQSKESVLKRGDKSSIGEWDKKIIPLCTQINSMENYYTSSSCSGRIIIMVDQEKKGEGLFLFASHDLVDNKEIKKIIEDLILKKENRNIKFKTEAPIIHVVCFDLESAQKLFDLAILSGFKKSGIISFKRKVVLEINSGEKIEFPLVKKGKVLVDENFLNEVVKDSNEKLKKSWKKLENLSIYLKKHTKV